MEAQQIIEVDSLSTAVDVVGSHIGDDPLSLLLVAVILILAAGLNRRIAGGRAK